MAELHNFIDQEASIPVGEEVQAIADAIRSQYAGVKAVLFYGSGLWKEMQDDTIVDLYVLVDRFRDLDLSVFLAACGSVLPPNVFYFETEYQGKTLRCKFAVMRISQFESAAKGWGLQPQIWARFAQPSRIVYSADDAVKARVVGALADSVQTFVEFALPLCEQKFTIEQLWQNGLAATYAAELRSEKKGRGGTIMASNPESFQKRAEYALQLSNMKVKLEGDACYAELSAARRYSGVAKMYLKRPFSKLMAVLRLTKAIFTFTNAVDYALWKIERQSGVSVKASEFQKRYPLIAAWPLIWKVYRQGGFR